jgi:hypothetical protein
METPKLYYLGEEKVSDPILGAQGSLIPASVQGSDRGENATDLQFVREQSEQVASGLNSFIGGGEQNTVSGKDSFAAAGSHNELTGDKAFASGEENRVSGCCSSALGSSIEVSGNSSNAAGTGHHVSGEASFAEGDGNIAAGYASHAEGGMNLCEGNYSHTEGMNAYAYNDFQHAKSSGGFSNPGETGEAQYTNIIARRETEDSIARELLVGEDKQVILMDNKMNAFRMLVVASGNDQEEGAGWELKGLISKKDTASTAALPGPVSKISLGGNTAQWDVEVFADTENGALGIRVRGEENKLIRWVAFVEMAEVAFYS